MKFRRIEPSDVDAVFNVRLSTRENAITLAELEEEYGVTPALFAKALEGNVAGWLAEDDGRVVGFATGNRRNGEVQVLAVLPEYENRGIGKALLASVCDWLFAAGHERIWLGANPDPHIRATSFYAKLGWRRSGEMKGQDEVLVLSRAEPSAQGKAELQK